MKSHNFEPYKPDGVDTDFYFKCKDCGHIAYMNSGMYISSMGSKYKTLGGYLVIDNCNELIMMDVLE